MMKQSGCIENCIYCVSVRFSVIYETGFDSEYHNLMHWFIYRVNWMTLFGCRELINIGEGFVAIAR